MSGYLTLDRVRSLAAKFRFFVNCHQYSGGRTKARYHRYGANHGLNRPLSAIVINAKAGMIE